jgi:hypothetical protein
MARAGGAAVVTTTITTLGLKNWHSAMHHSTGFGAVTVDMPTLRRS